MLTSNRSTTDNDAPQLFHVIPLYKDLIATSENTPKAFIECALGPLGRVIPSVVLVEVPTAAKTIAHRRGSHQASEAIAGPKSPSATSGRGYEMLDRGQLAVSWPQRAVLH